MSNNKITAEQIAAGAAVMNDDGKPVGRNTAVMVWDAMSGAATSGDAPTDGWPSEIYLNTGEGPLRNFSEYDEVDWCDHPQGENDVRYVRAEFARIERAAAPVQAARWLMTDGSCTSDKSYGEKYGGKPLGVLPFIEVKAGDAFIAPPGYAVYHAASGATESGDERAAFEAHEPLSSYERDGDYYANPCVQSAWEGWQARASVSAATKPTADLPPPAFTQHIMGGADVSYYTAEQVQSLLATKPAAPAEVYKTQRDNLLAFIQNAPVSSGVCCCGDDMAKHYSQDHSAVDMWDHSVLYYVEEFAKFDAAEGATQAGELPSVKQEKLRTLADRIDHENLWKQPMMYRDRMTDEQRDRLDAGIMLRRYSDLLAPGRWLLIPPTGSVRFSARSFDKVVEMAKRDAARIDGDKQGAQGGGK